MEALNIATDILTDHEEGTTFQNMDLTGQTLAASLLKNTKEYDFYGVFEKEMSDAVLDDVSNKKAVGYLRSDIGDARITDKATMLDAYIQSFEEKTTQFDSEIFTEQGDERLFGTIGSTGETTDAAKDAGFLKGIANLI